MTEIVDYSGENMTSWRHNAALSGRDRLCRHWGMAMSDEDQRQLVDFLGDLYPAVSGQLRGTLRRRGAPPWVIDDVISEAFARSLARPPRCPHTAFAAWINVVARNVYVDWCREQRRYAAVAELPDEVVDDVADAVELRTHFFRVCDAFSQLTAGQQEALRDLVDENTPVESRDRADVVRRAAARYRARAKLEKLLGETTAAERS